MGVRSQKWSQDNLRGKEHKIESPGRAQIRLECRLACVTSANDENGTAFNEWVQSAVLGYDLTHRLGVYAEWYSFHPGGAGKGRMKRS